MVGRISCGLSDVKISMLSSRGSSISLVLKKWSVDVATLGREAEMRFLDYCSRMMRENFIYNIGDGSLVYLNSEEQSFCRMT